MRIKDQTAVADIKSALSTCGANDLAQIYSILFDTHGGVEVETFDVVSDYFLEGEQVG